MTAPMTAEELADARALCEAATPGPWRHVPHMFSPNRGNILAGSTGIALDCYLADGARIRPSRCTFPLKRPRDLGTGECDYTEQECGRPAEGERCPAHREEAERG